MNMEDKIVVIQILDCWMRLTSIRWHCRAWNYYKSFTDYAESHGIKNVGQMIHANRFGEFEELCAGGLYLSNTWNDWLALNPNVRNQLACYLRAVNGLQDTCKFLWCGSALIGLHVTAPFMSMILDHNVTTRELLKILLALYSDLSSYNVNLSTVQPILPSLTKYFLDPFMKETTPYGVDVCRAIEVYLQSCDHELMNIHLKSVCTELARILKQQRGEQYGFGDNPDSSEHVLKNMSENFLDCPAATPTKSIENYFGRLDGLLKTSTPKGFSKSVDDLIIKCSEDLIESDKWRTKEVRDRAKKLKDMEKRFG